MTEYPILLNTKIEDNFTTNNIKDYETSTTDTQQDIFKCFMAKTGTVKKNDAGKKIEVHSDGINSTVHPIIQILSAIYQNDVLVHKANTMHSRSSICYLNQFQLVNLAEFMNDTDAYNIPGYNGKILNNNVFRSSFVDYSIRSALPTKHPKKGYLKDARFLKDFKSYPLNNYVYDEDSVINTNSEHNTLLQKIVNAIGITTLDVLSFQNTFTNDSDNNNLNHDMINNKLYSHFLGDSYDVSKITTDDSIGTKNINVIIITEVNYKDLGVEKSTIGKLLLMVNNFQYISVYNNNLVVSSKPYVWYPKTTDNYHHLNFKIVTPEKGSATTYDIDTTNQTIRNKFNENGFYVHGISDGRGWPHLQVQSFTNESNEEHYKLYVSYGTTNLEHSKFHIYSEIGTSPTNKALGIAGTASKALISSYGNKVAGYLYIKNIIYHTKEANTIERTYNLTPFLCNTLTSLTGTATLVSSNYTNTHPYKLINGTGTDTTINSTLSVDEKFNYIKEDSAQKIVKDILTNIIFLKDYVNTLEEQNDGSHAYKLIHYNTTMQVLNFFMTNMFNIFGPTKTQYIQLFGLQLLTLYEKMQVEGEYLKKYVEVANYDIHTSDGIVKKLDETNYKTADANSDTTAIEKSSYNTQYNKLAKSMKGLVMNMKESDEKLNRYQYSLQLQQNKMYEFEKQKNRMRNYFIGMVTLLLLYVIAYIYAMLYGIPYVDNSKKSVLLIMVSGIICISILGVELRLLMIDTQMIEGFSIDRNRIVSINSLYNILGVSDEYDLSTVLEKYQKQQVMFRVIYGNETDNGTTTVPDGKIAASNNNYPYILIISKFYYKVFGYNSETGAFSSGTAILQKTYDDITKDSLKTNIDSGSNLEKGLIKYSYLSVAEGGTINNTLKITHYYDETNSKATNNDSLFEPVKVELKNREQIFRFYQIGIEETQLGAARFLTISTVGTDGDANDNNKFKLYNNTILFTQKNTALEFAGREVDIKTNVQYGYIQNNLVNFITFYKSINHVLREKENIDLNYLNKNKLEKINKTYNLNSISKYNYKLLDFTYNQYIYLNVYLKLLTIAFSIIFILMNITGTNLLLGETLSLNILAFILIIGFVIIILHKTTEIRKKQFSYNQYRFTSKI